MHRHEIADFPLQAVHNPSVRRLLSEYLAGFFLRFDLPVCKAVAETFVALDDAPSVRRAEVLCKDALANLRIEERKQAVAVDRARAYAAQLQPWISGRKVLDFGCGNGLIG